MPKMYEEVSRALRAPRDRGFYCDCKPCLLELLEVEELGYHIPQDGMCTGDIP